LEWRAWGEILLHKLVQVDLLTEAAEAIEALKIRGIQWDFSLLRNPPSNVSTQSA
jgi:hypothetical protein